MKTCSIWGLQTTLLITRNQFPNLVLGLKVNRSGHFQSSRPNYERARENCCSIFNPNSEIREDPNHSPVTLPHSIRDLSPVIRRLFLSSWHMLCAFTVSVFSKFYIHVFSKDTVEKEAKVAFKKIIKHDKQNGIKILPGNINKTFSPNLS